MVVVARLTWTIPGAPQGWSRAGRQLVIPKYSKPFNITFDPAHNVSFKKLVRDYAFAAGLRTRQRHEGLVRLNMKFFKSRPKKFMRRADPPGAIYCGTTPDWDNLGKMISDALNAIAYKDDAQICDVKIGKYYHEKSGTPRTEITMEFLEEVEH
jgi:crossover junction endodeoxyribonuclease RusA